MLLIKIMHTVVSFLTCHFCFAIAVITICVKRNECVDSIIPPSSSRVVMQSHVTCIIHMYTCLVLGTQKECSAPLGLPEKVLIVPTPPPEAVTLRIPELKPS